jgi:hypothetical protein
MKKTLLLIVIALITNLSFADKLVKINYQGIKELKSLHANSDLKIHYSVDDFVIATSSNAYSNYDEILVNDCWNNDQQYYIAWFHKGIKGDYISQVSEFAEITTETNDYLFLVVDEGTKVHPPVDGRVVRITNKEIQLSSKPWQFNKGALLLDPEIEAMMEAVDTNIYVNNLQHLQNYGTRDAYTPQSVEAQNWIKEQYENMGYDVELFDFNMPSGPASDNVIATKTGSKYPEEFVMLGGHYDSFCYSGAAPGADDDGTGTCGVLEAARVMADFDNDRTIIFCAWSGEEYGLYGSEAYADWAADEGMNIIGYFNIDMCGYRAPGQSIHTDIIAPASAQPLVDFYTDVCALYLPDFIIEPGNLTGGDSDHTSFNNAGYMGIFPFEDSQNYSPYIHSPDDVIGLSVNSLEMAMTFTQAMVANVATMANYLAPPGNLIAIPGENQVELVWDEMLDIDNYNVYLNNDPDPIASPTDAYYLDIDVENFTTYTYYVTAIYTDTGEESDPSNLVTVTPLPPMSFPFFDDFESGAPYWGFEGSWGLSTNQYYSSDHSITESPNGNYGNNLDISANLYSFSLENAETASLSFYTKYALESGYDYSYLEISTNGNNWTNLETFNGSQNSWIFKEYNLDSYIGEPYVLIRINFYSDGYVTEDGMYIDDLELDVTEIQSGVSETVNSNINISPNPFNETTNITIQNLSSNEIGLSIYNSNGALVREINEKSSGSTITINFDAKNLSEGLYYCVIKNGQTINVEKLIISK